MKVISHPSRTVSQEDETQVGFLLSWLEHNAYTGEISMVDEACGCLWNLVTAGFLINFKPTPRAALCFASMAWFQWAMRGPGLRVARA